MQSSKKEAMKMGAKLYSVETKKSFKDAVVGVLKAVEKQGWTVFQVYDMAERLSAKGFSHQPLKIIEICSGKHASRVLNKDISASICLPCRINVAEVGGKTRIFAMLPSVLPEFFENVQIEDISEAERELREMIDNSA
jgi:uncharacterized protein (DUF302 family)